MPPADHDEIFNRALVRCVRAFRRLILELRAGQLGENGDQANLLTVKEVASWLRLHEKRIYEFAASGEIPCVRIGRSVRFRADDVNRWIENQRRR